MTKTSVSNPSGVTAGWSINGISCDTHGKFVSFSVAAHIIVDGVRYLGSPRRTQVDFYLPEGKETTFFRDEITRDIISEFAKNHGVPWTGRPCYPTDTYGDDQSWSPDLSAIENEYVARPEKFSGASLKDVLVALAEGRLFDVDTDATCDCYVIADDSTEAVTVIAEHYSDDRPIDSQGESISIQEYVRERRWSARVVTIGE